jgi:hypothetical protein
MEIIGAEVLKHREVSLYNELEKLMNAGGIGSFYEFSTPECHPS